MIRSVFYDSMLNCGLQIHSNYWKTLL